jgi:hypothetical protein
MGGCACVYMCGLCGRYLLSARAKTALKTFYASPNVDNVVRVWYSYVCFEVFVRFVVIGLCVRGRTGEPDSPAGLGQDGSVVC